LLEDEEWFSLFGDGTDDKIPRGSGTAAVPELRREVERRPEADTDGEYFPNNTSLAG
jgi:hypothetical protein